MDDRTKARLVAAVRQDSKVGRNTCSVIDECYTDDELAEMLESRCPGIVNSFLAVKIARQVHKTYHDHQDEMFADAKNSEW